MSDAPFVEKPIAADADTEASRAARQRIICLESTEQLEWCEPLPTRMRFPVEAAAKYFMKWIRGGCRPLGMKFFPLDGIKGGTVAAAPAR